MGLLAATPLEYAGRRPEEGGVTAFAFTPTRPLRHAAGQHAFLTLRGGGTKPFSLASAPEDGEVVIGTRLASGSRYKQALAALSAGDVVRLRGPVLRFTLDGSADDVVLVAEGVGVTPYRSVLRHITAAGLPKRTRLLHVGRAHPFRAETEHLAGQSAYPDDAEGLALELERATSDLAGATYYVSGAPPFVRSTSAAIAGAGIARRQIRSDVFRGC